MPEDFLHLKAMMVALLAFALLFAAAFAQRLYFRIRTRRVEAVETVTMRFTDFLALGAALLLGLLAIKAFSAWHAHIDWSSASQGAIARTIEVGNIDSNNATTLLVYRGDHVTAEEREEIIVANEPRFWVDVEVVRFSDVLHWFDQDDAIIVRAINSDKPEKQDRAGSWPWIRQHEAIRLESPKEIQRGDFFQIVVNNQNLIEIRKR